MSQGRPDSVAKPQSARGHWQRAARAVWEASGDADGLIPTASLISINSTGTAAESTRQALAQLCILVTHVSGLSVESSDQQQSLYIKAVIDNDRHCTPVIEVMGAQGLFREPLSFSLPDDHATEVELKLKRWRRILPNVVMGTVKIPLSDIQAAPEKWAEPQSLFLLDKKGKPLGTVLEVQVFSSYSQGVTGSLQVLCGTWNVGNEMPPPPSELQKWLKGVARSEPHIVAVAAQECNYTIRKSSAGGSTISFNGGPSAAYKAGGDAAATLSTATLPEELAAALPLTDTLAPEDVRITAELAARDVAAPSTQSSEVKEGLPSGASLRRGRAESIARVILDSVDSAPHWEQHISRVVGHNYCLVGSKHMYQTRLLVFARLDVMPLINKVQTGFEATGVGGVGVNKGGVGVALTLGATELAFVGCHLAAHQSKLAQRNSDAAEIIRNLKLSRAQGEDVVTGSQHIFWMGDLNYRLDYGEQALTQADSPTQEDFASLTTTIQARQYEELLPQDQLRKGIDAGQVLTGFKEGHINFAPTFKVTKGIGGCDYNRKRSPAWCDRVLVRSNLPHKPAQPLTYWATPEVITSDHKPVGASFLVPVAAKAPPHSQAKGSSGQVKLRINSISAADDVTFQALSQLLTTKTTSKIRPRLQFLFSGPALPGDRRKTQLLPMVGVPEVLAKLKSRAVVASHPLSDGPSTAISAALSSCELPPAPASTPEQSVTAGQGSAAAAAAAAGGGGGGGGGGADKGPKKNNRLLEVAAVLKLGGLSRRSQKKRARDEEVELTGKDLTLDLNSRGGLEVLKDRRLLCSIGFTPEGQFRRKLVARALLPLAQIITEAQARFLNDDAPRSSRLVVPFEAGGTVRGHLVMQVQLFSSARTTMQAKRALSAFRSAGLSRQASRQASAGVS